MGNFKDKFGKSRVKVALENLGKSEALQKITKAVTEVASGDVFGAIKSIISKETSLTPEQKEVVLKELERDIEESKQITERWKSDNEADSWLAKNVRPLTLLSLLLVFYSILFLDSFIKIPFEVKSNYVYMFENILITVIIAYFGSRGIKKMDDRRIKNGKQPLNINPFKKVKKND